MADNQNRTLDASPEQVLYARILGKGMYLGLLILFITFAIYVFGIMEPYVPTEKLTTLWSMNVHDYLTTVNTPTGWGWTGLLGYGDFVNFIGIALLAGVTIICYASIVPVLLKNNDKVFAVIAILEVLVLVLAASGILASGH